MQNLEFGAIENFLNQLKVLFECGKKGISFDYPLHYRQIQVRAVREGLLINLAAAANKDLPPSDRRIGGVQLLQIRDRLDPRYGFFGVCHHHCRPIGQYLADRLKGAPPHYDYLPRRHLFEPSKILGQMPGNLVASAYDPIKGHGSNGFERSHGPDAVECRSNRQSRKRAGVGTAGGNGLSSRFFREAQVAGDEAVPAPFLNDDLLSPVLVTGA
jgi:hypothetical protein